MEWIAAGAGIAGAIGFGLKNPKAIGSFLPLVATGWHEGRAELRAARRAVRQASGNARPQSQ